MSQPLEPKHSQTLRQREALGFFITSSESFSHIISLIIFMISEYTNCVLLAASLVKWLYRSLRQNKQKREFGISFPKKLHGIAWNNSNNCDNWASLTEFIFHREPRVPRTNLWILWKSPFCGAVFPACKAKDLVRKHVQEGCARPPTALFSTCQQLHDAKWASGFLSPDELFVSWQGHRVQPQDKGPFHFSCFPAPLLWLPLSCCC